MNALTSKGSSQQFFLRILKVIIQLRNSAAAKAVKATSSASGAARPAAAESTEAVAGTASQSHSDVAVAGESEPAEAAVDAGSESTVSEASPNAMEVDTGQWRGKGRAGDGEEPDLDTSGEVCNCWTDRFSFRWDDRTLNFQNSESIITRPHHCLTEGIVHAMVDSCAMLF